MSVLEHKYDMLHEYDKYDGNTDVTYKTCFTGWRLVAFPNLLKY